MASQIGHLLRGGWDESEVGATAVGLALQWDETRGFSKLLHLTQRQRAKTAQQEIEAHETRKREESRLIVSDGARSYIDHIPVLVGNTCKKCGQTARSHQLARPQDLRPLSGAAARITDEAAERAR